MSVLNEKSLGKKQVVLSPFHYAANVSLSEKNYSKTLQKRLQPLQNGPMSCAVDSRQTIN